MEDTKNKDKVNPEMREFFEKITECAFIVPTVLSVMTFNQKLNLSTANAQSNMSIPIPNCLSSDTLISTPDGNIPVTDLRPRMDVFTLDMDGNKVIKPIELTFETEVHDSHIMCHLILSDGREVSVSEGHFTCDKRMIGDLNPGDIIDGAKLTSIERTKYNSGYTYDLLPDGETECYWANGILLRSTQTKSRLHV